MKKIFLTLSLIFSVSAMAQDMKEPVLTIDDNNYSVEEFLHVYNKNRDLAQQLDPKSMDEYMDLFVNFKLKVLDAQAHGLDTSSVFETELRGYRYQLSRPYLVDTKVEEDLLQEAYDRLKEEVRASHILIKLEKGASPADTLKAFNKAMLVYSQLEKGANFDELAVAHSQDPSVKQNKGDLGYFTAMHMVYPFETAAYTTKVGSYSKPVRTSFGYHILNVVDRRPNPGRIQVAHIMVKHDEKNSAEAGKKKVDELYAKVQAGEDFSELAKSYSDDKQTARDGGKLPWFGTNKMVKEFEEAAFGIKEIDEVCAPIKSSYGWHIIKLLGKESMKSYDEEKSKLKRKLERNDRAYKKQKVFVDKLRKEYNYSLNKPNFKKVEKLVLKKDFLSPSWNMEKATKYYKKDLFSFADVKISQKDFITYLRSKAKDMASAHNKKEFVAKALEAYVDGKIMTYEDIHLEQKHLDFRMLLQEYHDGMLLYEISKKLVWDRASKDTTGLEMFYQNNTDRYMYSDRLDAGIYTCANEKLAKKAVKYFKKGKSQDWIEAKLNKKSSLNFTFENGLYEKKDHQLLENIAWEEGVSDLNNTNAERVMFVKVNKVLKPEPKEFDSVRGLVISDYQKHLEDEWLMKLKKEHKVQVHTKVFQAIKSGNSN